MSEKTVYWERTGQTYSLSDCKFSIIYLDNNKTPELVIAPNSASYADGYAQLYTYKKGKVLFLCTLRGYSDKYYKKKGVLIDSSLDYCILGQKYYKLSKGKLSLKLQKTQIDYPSGEISYYYGSNLNNTTKAVFNKKRKSLIGSNKKKSTIKYYNNTAANRKKYLK
ncbi:MAG: hypothetical protein LUF92_08320 [Clostridiales bacterium]|nr:hypothetical protein [Clostridiales bacterium]